MINLNIGSNNKRIEGYVNMDGLELEQVDCVCDLSVTPYDFTLTSELGTEFMGTVTKLHSGQYRFNRDTIDKIFSEEFLEHVSFKHTYGVLEEWFRILKPGGEVSIQVPDCGKAMEYYVRGEICDCVPHKGTNEEQVADPNCFVCGGKAKINPTRWLYSFTGAQKHKYDAHLNIFTEERLSNILERVRFMDIVFTDDPFKLKVKAIKPYV